MEAAQEGHRPLRSLGMRQFSRVYSHFWPVSHCEDDDQSPLATELLAAVKDLQAKAGCMKSNGWLASNLRLTRDSWVIWVFKWP